MKNMGAENKIKLTIGQIALLTLSTGIGGDIDYWNQVLDDSDYDNLWDDHYFRLALVNPF